MWKINFDYFSFDVDTNLQKYMDVIGIPIVIGN